MSKFTSFLLGGIIGAGVALFFAPQSGDKTRALVQERANALAGEAKGIADNVPGALTDAYQNVVAQGTELINNATAKVKEVTNSADAQENADELRQKIEAARQRIANQVMENAEQSKAVSAQAATEVSNLAGQAQDAVDTATEQAKDAVDAATEQAKDAADAAADAVAEAAADAAEADAKAE